MFEHEEPTHENAGALAQSESRLPAPARAEPAATAARRWLREYADILWRFALARTRSTEAAEEVLQETFAAAMKNYGSFAGRSSERTWLLGIAAHKVTDLQRRAAREARSGTASTASIESPSDFTADGRWARIPAPVSRLTPAEREDLVQALRRCLDAVPPGSSNLIWLRDVMGVPNEEIGKLVGITPTNLWTRLHRARAALRVCLEQAGVASASGGGVVKEKNR